MDRSKAPYIGKPPLPDAPWPVAAKGLLTNRERELYETLHALYLDYRLFAQVALSQLLDVPKSYPDRYSVRARFSQLVADFVLCLPNLSIVAVIELDDRSHAHPVRQAANARKTKALAYAGLRLVRVPKEPLPSVGALRTIIGGNGEQGLAFSPPVMLGPTADDSVAKRQAELQATTDLRRQKDRAWAVYYMRPASCEHPGDWNAQVECGNQYIRARKSFEENWSKDHRVDISVVAGR